MCGILAVLGLTGDQHANRVKVLRASRQQRHRGPDATSVYAGANGNYLAFERLNIVDVTEAGRWAWLRASGQLPALPHAHKRHD
jgi:asparagine synthase (glutamine-hydrolysing)